MRTRQEASLTEDVYAELRRAVLHGALTPGERLHLGDLARRCGVSLGVVREAVTRLASERLLDATPQTGFRVRSLSVEHLVDLTWARCEVEALAVRESVRHGDTAWEGALVAAAHVLAVTSPRGPDGSVSPDWMTAHRRFHAALAAGCPNRTLLEVRQQLFDEAELYRHWSAAPRRGADRDVRAEHAELVTAALARDGDRAAALLVGHLRLTAALVEHPGTTV